MSFSFGAAAWAVPVTFTYTSNTVDWSELEDWEATYMANSLHIWNVLYPDLQAEITLEVDCSFTASGANCLSLSQPQLIRASRASSRINTGVRLGEVSGFTDSIVRLEEFRVGRDGEVQDWLFTGAEYGQVGDFQLSGQGDTWAYAGWSSVGPLEFCEVIWGTGYNEETGACNDGVAGTGGTLLRLGTGTWTSNINEYSDLIPAPLPAGMSLLVAAFALLGLTRLKRFEK